MIKKLTRFENALREDEKSTATIEKYLNEARRLYEFAGDRPITKQLLLEYRETLLRQYKARTVNNKLSALNAYLEYIQKPEYKIKLLRIQRAAFTDEKRELSKQEYKRLLNAAKRKNERLYILLLTLCGTGIRVSELQFITVEAARRGRAEIFLKGKSRLILIPCKLAKLLLQYAKRRGLTKGRIFQTKNGNPLDRSNICHEMKKICPLADVNPQKVFPHNLRHLFAKVFFEVEHNIAHLADVLGHSSIETTRIYIAVSAHAHAHTLEKMQLIS